MLRTRLIENDSGLHNDFRWRGGDVSRLEGLSDAVFGFAITLLVVSLEVPKTFTELLASLSDFGAFGLSFMFLMLLWYAHYQFYRRYGLQNSIVALLNTVFLFVVVLYVYPLKFLFTLITRQFLNQDVSTMIHPEQSATLFIVYGLGFIAIYSVLALMYAYAYRKGADLALTPLEKFTTVEEIGNNLLLVGVGTVSIFIALSVSNDTVNLAGLAYPVLIFPLRTIYATVMGYRRRKLKERLSTGQPDAQTA